LKFLQQLRQARLGTSNRKSALVWSTLASAPFSSEVRVRRVPRGFTNFGERALVP
jgi:hypothetical protein